MLVLALDTSTPTVSTALALVSRPHEVTFAVDGSPQPLHRILAQRSHADGLAHVEHLLPLVAQTAADAEVRLPELDAVVVGLGPGPFTGLRVGIATAAALGDALDIPVHGLPSHDGVAVGVAAGDPAGDFLVVTDARRREVYLTAYRADGRTEAGPAVLAPLLVPEWLAERRLTPVGLAGSAAPLLAESLPGLPVFPPAVSPVAGLIERSLRALLTGVVPGPLTPLYLRQPDAVASTSRKSVLGRGPS